MNLQKTLKSKEVIQKWFKLENFLRKCFQKKSILLNHTACEIKWSDPARWKVRNNTPKIFIASMPKSSANYSSVRKERNGTFICELILERYKCLRNTQKQLKITNFVRNESFSEFYLVYDGVFLKFLGSIL